MNDFPVSCVLGVLGLCGYVACAGLVFAGDVYEFFVVSRKNVVLHRFIKFLSGIFPHHLPVKGPDHPVLGGGSRKGGRGTCSRCGLKYVRWLGFCRELFQRHGGTHQWLADDARLQHVRRG